MIIGIGSDHGGFELKEFIKEYLDKLEVEFVDFGTYNNDSVDYPDFGKRVADRSEERRVG